MANADDGYEVIPASRRPDGTWRKERKVKAGYVPPDEVEKYESKGKRFMNDKPALPPGYVPPVTKAKPMNKNQKKNERRKQKQKEKTEIEKTQESTSVEKEMSELAIKQEKNNKASTTATEVPISDKSLELQKKIKAVRKKLKQCNQLKERQTKGESLEKEQLEKINKMEEFEDELENLELELDKC